MNKEKGIDIAEQRLEQDVGTEIDLLDLLYYLKTKLLFLIAAVLIGSGIAGVGTYFLVTPTYQANAYLYMVSASSGSVIDLSDLNMGSSVATDYIQLLTRRPILENVADELGDITVQKAGSTEKEQISFDNTSQLASYITISTVADSRMLKLSITTPYPELSKEIANELADQATDYIPKIMNVAAPTVAEYAVTPTGRAAPSYTKNIAYGALIALALVTAVLTMFYVLDDSIKTVEDMEKYFNITPLTIIPEGKIDNVAMHPYREKRGEKL